MAEQANDLLYGRPRPAKGEGQIVPNIYGYEPLPEPRVTRRRDGWLVEFIRGDRRGVCFGTVYWYTHKLAVEDWFRSCDAWARRHYGDKAKV